MFFKVNYDTDFDTLMMHLWSKYGKELFDIDGIGKQTDMDWFAKNFFNNKATTADSSVDSNSNVSSKNINVYNTEFPKPFKRYNSYYLLWKELKRKYGLETANTIIENQLTGDIYINDFTSIGECYCFNYSMYDVALFGLNMVDKIECSPPKYLYSYRAQVEQFTIIAANCTLGATGLADFLIVMSYYVKKILDTGKDAHFTFATEQDIWEYVRQTIKAFIYTMNQPNRSAQSCFSNVSIYDGCFLDNMIGDYKFPDGGCASKEITQKLQYMYCDIMNETLSKTPCTFPVTTACFSITDENEIVDERFLNMVSEKILPFGFINIYYGDTATLSSCCFQEDQKVLTKSSAGIRLTTIKDIHEMAWKDKPNLTVFHNGSWCSAKTVKLPYTDTLYRITTTNNKEILVTKDHLNPTIKGDIKSENLVPDDYLLMNSRRLNTYPEVDNKMTLAQGFLIGLYAGDGSSYKRKDSECYEITFSLNANNESDIQVLKTALTDWGIDKEIHIHFTEHNVMFAKIYDKELFMIIKRYISGSYAHEKSYILKEILSQSALFREGIIKGWYASDGGNSNRIYSCSEDLIETGECIFTSLGINTVINEEDRRGKITIRGAEYNRNYISRCIRWYGMKNKRSMKGIYKVHNNSEYFKIKAIEKVDYTGDVYCFEMANKEEPYFTLPNGIITHNCRLRSNTKNQYFNSFGAGSSKIGSLGVVTINLPRLARLSNGSKSNFLYMIEKLVQKAAKINDSKRNIIRKRINKGSYPLYSLGYMHLKKQYSTVGITGLYEALKILGKDITTPEGVNLGLETIKTINSVNSEMEEHFKYPHNCEQVPAENSSIKLVTKDRCMGFEVEEDLYSNQFVPLTVNVDVLDRIKLQGIFDKHFTGGAICHINLDQPITDFEKMKNLIITCAKNGVIYWAPNYVLNRCENRHMTVGNSEKCSICGSGIEDTFTRVVGFLVNTKNFHKVRREKDFPNRQWYKGNKI